MRPRESAVPEYQSTLIATFAAPDIRRVPRLFGRFSILGPSRGRAGSGMPEERPGEWTRGTRSPGPSLSTSTRESPAVTRQRPVGRIAGCLRRHPCAKPTTSRSESLHNCGRDLPIRPVLKGGSATLARAGREDGVLTEHAAARRLSRAGAARRIGQPGRRAKGRIPPVDATRSWLVLIDWRFDGQVAGSSRVLGRHRSTVGREIRRCGGGVVSIDR